MVVGSGSASRVVGRCVLVFHRIVTSPAERDHDVSWPDFLTLLDRLQGAGCTFAGDLAAPPRDGSVVLTFDDGTKDHSAAANELAKRGLPAIFFVPAGPLGHEGYLDPAAIPDLVAGGHVIGSHGWSHRRLDQMAGTEQAHEIRSSRSKLEDLAGEPVTLFAPPGGIEGTTLSERLRAAGYVASRSTRWGIHRRAGDQWRIPSVPVTHVTMDRGWVVAAATKHHLPIAMTAVGALRRTMRPDVRTAVRARFHGLDADDGANGGADSS